MRWPRYYRRIKGDVFMKKFTNPLVILCALLFSQTTHAEIPNGHFSGYVNVYSQLSPACEMNVEIDNDSAFIQMGICGVFFPYDIPFSITRTADTVTFHNVLMYTLAGGPCQGDLTAEWDGTELIFDTTLPSQDGIWPDCQIYGAAWPQN